MNTVQHPRLLQEIEEYLSLTGMGEAYFGKKSARNSELVRRLRDGGRIWPETADRVRRFMAGNPPASSEKGAA